MKIILRDFTYDWSENREATMLCAGDGRKWGQSPIDIDEEKAVGIKFPALVMSGHWSQDRDIKMTNTGTTVQITLEGKTSPATIRGGPLGDDVYEFAELVFRWGSSNCKGAEHTLNGTWFTMEAQAIHFNTKYETLDNCRHKKDGLAICVYFLQACQLPIWDEHPLFSKITDNLYNITQAETFTKLPANALSWMRQACKTPGYYNYLGSTTTYPYYENVTWMIFPEAVMISENQAKLFRTICNKRGACIKENYRDVQPLNGRVVYYVN
ncbi:carbonic anhydrase 2 [Lasioglossum baleicum]|uniref:carbonic anhydrase 2 n=1 Tax=Lasioglossum baleicum TaxID=434251 RepID=UPI003FCDC3FD